MRLPAQNEGVAGAAGEPAACGTVIVYHGVGDCPPRADPYHLILPTAEFAWQMAFLAQHRRVVPLGALVDLSLGEGRAGAANDRRPAVAITFDDGYRSLLEIALPILERLGFPATAFVPSGWTGDRNRWDPSPPGARPVEIMDADEVRECARRGVEIESHGHRHVHLTRVSPEEAAADLASSHATLAEILGRAPRYVAYPWGEHSAAVRDAAARAGFVAGFSINQIGYGHLARERVAIRRSDTRPIFWAKSSGPYLRVRMSLLPRAGLRLAEPALRRYRRYR